MSWSRLVEIIAKLRAPDGCPWDREQTHTSLKRYLLEETYELFEAIDQNNPRAIMDELGDVLLQVLLHAQIGAEGEHFTIDDVISNLSEKLIRRHPHVFGEGEADTPAEVARNWDAIKRTEKAAAERTSVLDGVPRVFPALMRAEKVQKKAAKVGFDWDEPAPVLMKVEEELDEVREAYRRQDQEALQEELGDLLFAAVNFARFVNVDPEFTLQEATDKFVERFRLMEEMITAEGGKLEGMTLEEMDRYWEKAKLQLRRKPQS
ncbi:MAG: nucleoside triphosphate pyrophosphohydrolase [Firmicutes bacterium]|jgi:tetrapyrrole methylase family protein/MazG family protein|nr:nucleoside triphosphate pyrophosphohydrolase [Bacillota bacterium]NLO66617.1 nucleoside triphosphate pyrophosphohydrolase [Bacillota bacterium]